jgi:hypothetical protein
MIYGPSFENKKGFIIDGTIVLNHDRFDSTTVFHEFDIIMLGGLSIIQSTCCSYGECTEYIQSDIPWYSYVQYHRLKVFRN